MEVVLDDRNIDLVQEGIDVALRMGQLSDSSLTAKRIASGRHVVVGTPAYFERTRQAYGTRRPRRAPSCDLRPRSRRPGLGPFNVMMRKLRSY